MNTAITIFQRKEFGEVRTVLVNEEPYFCNNDVCRVLDISNPRNVIPRLDEGGVHTVDTPTSSGDQPMTFISEPNLYRVIFQSRKPIAEKFITWITSEVIPSIRKHGAYMTPQVIERSLTDPDFLIQLATTLKEERQKRLRVEEELKINAPKVNFAESVEISRDCILVRFLSNILKQNGIDIGQNRLFDKLRDLGYLIKSGRDKNMPTQRAMELGLFEVKERTINTPDGEPKLKRTPLVTGKGQIYFVNLLLNT